MKNLYVFLFVICSIQSIAQTQKRFSVDPIIKTESNNLSNAEIISKEIHSPGGGYGKQHYLDSLKNINRTKYPHTKDLVKKSSIVDDLIQGTTFDANSKGIPNDNSFAISNDGIAISAINSSFWYYDTNTGEKIGDENLVDVSGITSTLSFYDPKLIYDPINDRFIAVFLKAFDSNASKIYACFSKTNNPLDGWNSFAIEGNPNSIDEWSDYPAISITDNDLFITMNLLKDNISWQLGFQETIIWQINKDEGYNNQTLNPVLWQGIEENNLKIRNLHPVRNYNHYSSNDISTHLTTDNQYFLSNRNFSTESDSIYLVEITGPQSSTPSIIITLINSSDKYYLSRNGQQSSTNELSTNDSRILGGIINRSTDVIQFVNHSLDPNTGTASIYHGYIENYSSTPSCSGTIISDSNLDFGYPNIASTSQNLFDNECIIGFNYVSPSDFAGTCAIYYDETGNYSNVTKLSYGAGIIGSAGSQRWGDYSGIQRKYNQPEVVWFTGTFAKEDSQTKNISRGTWVSQIFSANFVDLTEDLKKNYTLYPNPTDGLTKIEFTAIEKTTVNVYLTDINGKKIVIINESKINKGVNELIFNTSNLPSGTYILNIINTSQSVIKSDIVIVK